jgi:hypothetical protein
MLYVTEFRSLRILSHLTYAPFLQATPLANQALTPGASSAQSAAFGGETQFVRIHTDSPVLVNIGADPNADTGWRLGAGNTEIYAVQPGHKLAHKTTT